MFNHLEWCWWKLGFLSEDSSRPTICCQSRMSGSRRNYKIKILGSTFLAQITFFSFALICGVREWLNGVKYPSSGQSFRKCLIIKLDCVTKHNIMWLLSVNGGPVHNFVLPKSNGFSTKKTFRFSFSNI